VQKCPKFFFNPHEKEKQTTSQNDIKGSVLLMSFFLKKMARRMMK